MKVASGIGTGAISRGSDPPAAARPRLLFFQILYKASLPEFLLIHMREQVACLRQFFDVTVISRDCDLGQMCDRYRPDLILFETGANILTAGCRRPIVRNVRSNAAVPRIGFINADAWCETRAGTMSELHYWDATAVFSICSTVLEHTPALAHWPVFVLPNFVDTAVFHDHGEAKTVPVLLTGSLAPQYPWRRAVYPLLGSAYRSEIAAHPGYLDRSAPAAVFGVAYARSINRAWFVPTCGTIAKELVRKHLEIPAANACLLTERAPALEQAGFVDMENCVFVDGTDVLEKVRELLAEPAALGRIIRAGHRLVHERHAMRNRDQLAQWYRLWKTLTPGQRIVQPGLFENLRIGSDARQGIAPIFAGGAHLTLVRRADQKLWANEYTEAKAGFEAATACMRALPEAHFRLALCDLGLGNAAAATDKLFKLLFYVLARYRAPDPDPVEFAYFLVALVCSARVRAAARYAKDFAWLEHPELDRARRLVAAMSHGTTCEPGGEAASRQSVHALPPMTDTEWVRRVSAWSQAAGHSQRIHLSVASARRGPAPIRPWDCGSLGKRIWVHKVRLKFLAVGDAWQMQLRNAVGGGGRTVGD